MHHVHISNFSLFLSALFIFGPVALVLAFIRSMKRDRLLAERRAERLAAAQAAPHYPQHDATRNDGAPYRSYGAAAPSSPVIHQVAAPSAVYTSPVNVAAPYYGVDPGLAMVEGMLIGEALSHHDHTTIINEGPTYVDSSPSYDSGFDYSDSGSSFDTSCDTSGGVSFDW